MRGLLICILASAVVIFGEIDSFGVMNEAAKRTDIAPGITEIICEVTDIKGNTLEATDIIGGVHEFSAAPKVIEGFKLGDSVYVELKDGEAVSIYK